MRKLIALLLAFCLLAFTACDTTAKTKETTPESTGPTIPQTTSVQPADSTMDIENRYEDNSHYSGTVTIDETVLYDENDIRIVALRVGLYWGEPAVSLRIENNSHTNIHVNAGNLIVNGISTYGALDVEVAAGSQARGELEIYALYLKYARIDGLDAIGTIACENAVIYNDQWDTLDTFGFEIKTSIADTVSYEVNIEGEVIYEDDAIKLTRQTDYKKIMGDAEYMFVVENKLDYMLDVSFDDISLNGCKTDIFAYGLVSGGAVCFIPFTFCDEDVAQQQIKAVDVTDIAFKITYSDMDYNNRHTTEEITLRVG